MALSRRSFSVMVPSILLLRILVKQTDRNSLMIFLSFLTRGMERSEVKVTDLIVMDHII